MIVRIVLLLQLISQIWFDLSTKKKDFGNSVESIYISFGTNSVKSVYYLGSKTISIQILKQHLKAVYFRNGGAIFHIKIGDDTSDCFNYIILKVSSLLNFSLLFVPLEIHFLYFFLILKVQTVFLISCKTFYSRGLCWKWILLITWRIK